jgi:exopolysaccharide biosynthesis polyprenyl glycosylphosphotransferase
MIRRESWLGFDILGALIDRRDRSIKDHTDPKTLPTSASGVPILGAATVDSVMEHAQGINTVVYAGGAPLSHRERRLLNWELEKLHVHAIIAPGLSDTADHRVQSRHAGGIPLVYVSPPTWTRALRFSKRAFDVILASIAILLTSPLMLWAVIAITVTDGRPIFYRSYRIGREGRPFAFFKFRTMIKDADQLVDTLRDEHGVDDFLFKMQTDPRIIRPGRFMRRWSIDELPQLFNVLKGDMSLIGPRPALQDEVDRYDEIMQRRLRVRPGITGLWQVSGRSDLSLEDSVRLDLYYVDNWSMLQDLTILTKTVLAVLGGKGAY